MAALLLTTSSASVAEDFCNILHPCKVPVTYRGGPFLARPVVRDLPFRGLQAQCGTSHLAATGGALGCAIFRGDECHVYLPKEFRERMPDFYKHVMEHELAHCRGWRHG